MPENLVFLPDSPFSEWIISRSESVFKGGSRYVSFAVDVPAFPNSACELLGTSIDDLKEIAHSFNNYKRIIIHYHNATIGYLLEMANPKPQNVIWVVWSGDLYNSPFFDQPLYFPLTQVWGESSLLKAPKGVAWVKEGLKYFLKRPSYFAYKFSFGKIRTVASFFEGDFGHAKRIFGANFRHLPFAILSIDELLIGIPEEQYSKPGNKVLLGHAGVPENNHLDLFPLIGKICTDRTIICPLAYGKPAYIQAVTEAGQKHFGDRFEAVTDFLPRDQYYLMLCEVGFAVFNTLIQQAFGNILGLLYLGVKVFLNPQNSIYQKLSQLGFVLFTLDELTPENLEEPLSMEEIAINQRILKESLSEQRVQDYYRELICSESDT